MRVGEFISAAHQKLQLAPIQCADPKLHAHQLIEAYFGWRSGLSYLNDQNELGDSDLNQVNAWLARRLTGEPFQYIIGYEWFWKSRFYVGAGVLIPRPETEHLVEEILRESGDSVSVVELGAGSGNIGISVLLERPTWRWMAFEKNPLTIPYLKKNLELLPWGTDYLFQQGDFFELAPRTGLFDLVVSNPPYVARGEIASLSTEVRSEPAMALDGGELGTELPRRFLLEGGRLLRPGGKIIFEIGAGQRESIDAYMKEVGYEDISFIKDYSGIWRVGKGTWNGRVSH